MSGSRRLPIIFVSLFTAILICNAILIPIFINKEVPEDPPTLLEQYGFDEELINAAYSRCLTMSYLESVLVLRHGDLVIEWYFNGGSRDGSFEIMSAAKSFMSTIFGIACDKGYFPNLDRKIMDYFPEFSHLLLDARVYNVTIRHLLQMKAGFNYNDTADEWIEYSNSPNWAKYVLELGFRHDPGEIWWYSTIQTNLLSIILTKATGMSTKVFADSYLFNPLGISIDY
ncbi:MAG: serine hydrolase [Candidatus Heimdallarchaeota archaeon]|nr:serine hydrolase [Candidatus Heimdallarchaeota archaeon]MBY8993111.1 serine hydrolase [Candidatus Heimdallarchaeota archaeon]